MKTFFDKSPSGYIFREFSALHFVVVALLLAVIVITCLKSKAIRQRPRLRQWLPIAVGAVAWGLQIAYNVWTYVNGLDFLKNLLPLELCSISLFLTVILAPTRSHRLFQVYYFFSVGALMAVLFPSFGGYGPNNVRFWHYFITHCYIIWLDAYFLSVEQSKLGRHAYGRLLTVMVPLAAIIKLIDDKFGVDYMFLSGPSGTASPLNFLGTGNGYFARLVLIALAAFFVMFLAAPKEQENS